MYLMSNASSNHSNLTTTAIPLDDNKDILKATADGNLLHHAAQPKIRAATVVINNYNVIVDQKGHNNETDVESFKVEFSPSTAAANINTISARSSISAEFPSQAVANSLLLPPLQFTLHPNPTSRPTSYDSVKEPDKFVPDKSPQVSDASVNKTENSGKESLNSGRDADKDTLNKEELNTNSKLSDFGINLRSVSAVPTNSEIKDKFNVGVNSELTLTTHTDAYDRGNITLYIII